MIPINVQTLYDKNRKVIGSLLKYDDYVIIGEDIDKEVADIKNQLYAHAVKNLHPDQELKVYELSLSIGLDDPTLIVLLDV